MGSVRGDTDVSNPPPHIPKNLPRDEREAIARRHGYELTENGGLRRPTPYVEPEPPPTLEKERESYLCSYGCRCPSCTAAHDAGGPTATHAVLAFEAEVAPIVVALAANGSRAGQYGHEYSPLKIAQDAEAAAVEIVRH